MAGHSRRFKKAGFDLPKFLIDIGGRTMLEHVVDMFNENDKFYFIINETQNKQNSDLVQWLTSITKRCEVIVIPEHELGPVYSCLSIESIDKSEPVIVTYCDFLVKWNYSAFLRDVVGYEAAIPAFRGFHPASYGHTKYAYMRVNENQEMLELREKESFTENRAEEYASAGIYYFQTWSYFRNYAEKILEIGFGNLNEAYVSLLSNLIVQDGGKILVTEVNKFICLGTPEDLAQYIYWSDFFRIEIKNVSKSLSEPFFKNSVNLVPSAGRGSRFVTESYRVNKPLIQVGKVPMFLYSSFSLPVASRWIFLFREEVVKKNGNLSLLIEENFNSSCLIPVIGDTSGQAATCLLAENELSGDETLLIASCDYITIWDENKFNQLISDETIDIVIFTYRPGSMLMKAPEAFAWCETDNSGMRVQRVAEKMVISDNPGLDPLLIGTFWFRQSKDFIYAAKNAINNGIAVNGEHYIGNSLNYSIECGKKVLIYDVQKWVSLGDPFELETYYYWEDYFNQA